MAIEVLGISGSPIPDSNTDRAVKRILQHTGMETRFVKLSELTIEPCRACLGCVETNRCVVEDDGRALAEQFHEAPAFVLGAFTPYSSLDARTKAFMERMYCFRHQVGGNAGKVAASVITTACPPGVPQLPPAAETATNQVAVWMMAEGIINLGSMVILGNVPCIRCGHGDDCTVSGLKMIHGPEASVASIEPNALEADAALMEAAEQLGKKLGDAVRSQTAG